MTLTLAALPGVEGSYAGTGGLPLRKGTVTVKAAPGGSATVDLSFEDGGWNGRVAGVIQDHTLTFMQARFRCVLTLAADAVALGGDCSEQLTVEARAPLTMPMDLRRILEAPAPSRPALFSIPMPQGWHTVATTEQMMEVANADATAHLRVDVQDGDAPLALLEKQTVKALQASFKTLTVLHRSNTTLDGTPARQLLLSVTQDGVPLKMAVILCVRDHRVVVMEGAAPATSFDGTWKQDLLPAVNRFRFTRPL